MRIGLYEKGLPPLPDWPARMAACREAGFDFLEIAVDETDDKRARLDWSRQERKAFRDAATDAGLPVFNIIFSILRRYPLGAPDPAVRVAGLDFLEEGIALATDLGIRCIQIPGYYSFYEPAGPDGAARFEDSLARAAGRAADAGVMLGIENMDGTDVLSLRDALRYVDAVGSPWLQLYPDIGNLSANGLDVADELTAAAGRMIGIHLKDTRPGEYRRVPFGQGTVPFDDAFRVLAQTGYRGSFLIEMWNDGDPDSLRIVTDSLAFIRGRLAAAYDRTGDAA